MDDVITDVKDVTPEWLTAVLRTNGHLDHERVTAVKLKASRQTTISNTHHLEITYSAVTSQRSPSKLFLKLSKPGFDSEIAARFGKKESQYYNVIAKSMNDPPSTTCYDAAFSPDIGKSHDWDACWYDYRLSAIGNLFTPIWQWSTNLWPAIWWPHLERAILTFEDLDCEQLLL